MSLDVRMRRVGDNSECVRVRNGQMCQCDAGVEAVVLTVHALPDEIEPDAVQMEEPVCMREIPWLRIDSGRGKTNDLQLLIIPVGNFIKRLALEVGKLAVRRILGAAESHHDGELQPIHLMGKRAGMIIKPSQTKPAAAKTA